MANELTRKGIAFGAAVALGSTLIVGGVANAAPNANYQDLELNLAEDSNGVLATIAGDYVGMVLSWNGDVDTQNFDKLAYNVNIVNDPGTEDEGEGYGYFVTTYASYDTYEDQVVADTYGGEVYGDEVWDPGNTTAYAPHAGDSFTDTEDEGGINWTGPVPAWDASNGTVGRDADGDLTYYDAPYIEFGAVNDYSNYIDYKAEFTVQAFVDTNDNGVIDSTETHSAPVTVTFYNPTALEWVLELEDDGTAYYNPADVDDDGYTEIGYTAYIAEQLNDTYLGEDNWEDFFYGDEVVIYNDVNYEYLSIADEDGYMDADWGFEDSDYTYDYNWAYMGFDDDFVDGKHLVDTGELDVDLYEDFSTDMAVNHIGIAVADDQAEDGGEYYADYGLYTGYMLTDAQQVTLYERTARYAQGSVVEQTYVLGEDFINGTYEGSNEDTEDMADASIRDSVSSLSYQIQLFTEEDEAAGAGIEVTTQLTDNGSFDDDYGLKSVNGVDATEAEDGSNVVDVTATTNADGIATFNIVVQNQDAEDLNEDFGELEVTVEGAQWEGWNQLRAINSNNGAAGGADAKKGNLNWEETVYEIALESGLYDDFTIDGTVGESVEFDVYARDQWGQAPQEDLRLEVHNEDDRGDWDYIYPEFNSNGVATVVLDDTGEAAEDEDGEYDSASYEWDPQVKVNGGWDAIDNELETQSNWFGDEDINVNWHNDNAKVGFVTAQLDTDYAEVASVNYGAFFTKNLFLDWRELADTNAYNDVNYMDGTWLSIEGNVRAATGYGIAGTEVTVSGAGLQFSDDYDEVGYSYSVNSLTTRTEDGGYFYVYVSSHIVGEHTLTITSGGKSTTVDIVIDDSNLYASAVEVHPFTGKAGTAEAISASVTDKWGNLVPDEVVSFSVTGGGYFNTETGTTGGDADDAVEDIDDAGYGVASSTLVIMSGEVGYGMTVTATIDVYDPLEVAEDTTASASLAAGATNFGKPAFWTKDMGDGTVKLYAKNIVGAGKIQFFHNGKEIAWVRAVDALDAKLRSANGAYYLVRTVKLVSGKNVFEIKDDGNRVVRRVANK